jgi:large subunit ribosomal protein L15
MQLNTLKPKTDRRDVKRVGRGRASGKGKTSGRGTKGQRARAGHKIWPNVREQLKKLPKLRGRGIHGLHSFQMRPLIINLSTLEQAFNGGDTITPKILLERGIISARKGTTPAVKILGDGELAKKLVISGCTFSASAKEKIEKAGGSIT